MAPLRRSYNANHSHFVTTNTYRRARPFDSVRFKRKSITSMADLRAVVADITKQNVCVTPWLSEAM